MRNAKSMLTPLRILASLVLVPMLLNACTSMSAEECSVLDWRSVGYEDGVAGLPGSHIGQYRKACAKHGVGTDLAAYQAGREMGLKEYCQPANGFRVGARGDTYQSVCPAPQERDFLDSYESGHELFTLERRASNARRQLAEKREDLNRIEQEIVSAGAVLVASDTTTEDRAHALVETRQLAEEKGRTEVEIADLERDRARYERDLEAYQATLAANR
jgi:Protein of unknown function (DUF2799)